MAKKLFGLSMFLWILIVFVVLFLGFGVGKKEGFKEGERAVFDCSSSKNKDGCENHGCTWTWNSDQRKGSDGICSGTATVWN